MAKDSLASHYSGAAGREYFTGRQDVLNHLGYTLQARFFLPVLTPQMQVLDFGCGNGSLAKAIAPHVAGVEGLEVNEHPRDLARAENGLKVYASMDEIPPTNRYDAIISNHVLEHIPNVVDTLRHLRGHLKPGGLFVTMLPLEDFRAKLNQTWRADDRNHHLHTWTPLLFGNTLAEAGFQPIKLRVVTHAWSPKLFFLGDNALLGAACWLMSAYLKRRQLLGIAKAP